MMNKKQVIFQVLKFLKKIVGDYHTLIFSTNRVRTQKVIEATVQQVSLISKCVKIYCGILFYGTGYVLKSTSGNKLKFNLKLE